MARAPHANSRDSALSAPIDGSNLGTGFVAEAMVGATTPRDADASVPATRPGDLKRGNSITRSAAGQSSLAEAIAAEKLMRVAPSLLVLHGIEQILAIEVIEQLVDGAQRLFGEVRVRLMIADQLGASLAHERLERLTAVRRSLLRYRNIESAEGCGEPPDDLVRTLGRSLPGLHDVTLWVAEIVVPDATEPHRALAQPVSVAVEPVKLVSDGRHGLRERRGSVGWDG
jgi:hypothetical protein